ncbi:Detected protein of unknown function [Hibiscus syriacus]|uniref:Uncharacterized protein n=1 Tax=Hibiscus syriacus TaxID=106335 RepID=A0A6A3C3A8_HIBSY|nr:uncharacterized protein LOC120206593 [Hibiscus syriacus]KAE8722531.1 Detected protein of unknown function [Hibiscus syriacus]
MEGLIPLVYRTLKKAKTRLRYERLSSVAAAQPYNIADFYVQSPTLGQTRFCTESNSNPVPEENIGRHGHRRRMSTGNIPEGSIAVTGGSRTPTGPKLTRFKSHRMFSCVTG